MRAHFYEKLINDQLEEIAVLRRVLDKAEADLAELVRNAKSEANEVTVHLKKATVKDLLADN